MLWSLVGLGRVVFVALQLGAASQIPHLLWRLVGPGHVVLLALAFLLGVSVLISLRRGHRPRHSHRVPLKRLPHEVLIALAESDAAERQHELLRLAARVRDREIHVARLAFLGAAWQHDQAAISEAVHADDEDLCGHDHGPFETCHHVDCRLGRGEPLPDEQHHEQPA